jgi:hypothetical protein
LSYYNDPVLHLPAPRAAFVALATRAAAHRAVLCSVAALAAGVLYLNALHNPFVYDDYHTVVQNTSLERPANVRALVLHDVSRPLVNASYAVDRAIWGSTPFGFHVSNVLLHVLNVILLFHLAWRLAGSQGRQPEIVAFATAVLFAVHPMMTEAVAYISGRSELLCGAFFLTALLCGRRWIRGDGARWAFPTMACWAAALASKELAAMFPMVLFCLDLFEAGGRLDRRRLQTVHLPLASVAAAAAIVRVIVLARVEYPGQAMIRWDYVPIALDVVGRYLWLLVTSRGQAMFHEVAPIRSLADPRAAAGVGTAVLLLALVWTCRRRAGMASFGIVWFLLLLVPSSVLLILDQGEPMAEHRVYLASAGLFLACGAGARSLAETLHPATRAVRLLAVAAAGVGVVSLSTLTVLRNALWSDPVALWGESVRLAPNHYRPRLLLGEALQDAGRWEAAVDQFQRAVELRPVEPVAYTKLGLGLAQIGRLAEAEATFTRLEEIDPRSAAAATGLGALAVLAREPARAREHFLQAIDRDPRSVVARQSLAMLSEMEPPNPAEALRWCEEIRRMAPGTPGNDECIGRNRSRIAIDSGSR